MRHDTRVFSYLQMRKGNDRSQTDVYAGYGPSHYFAGGTVSKRILIVGGTGMLATVALFFAKAGDAVFVVARSGDALNDLVRRALDLDGSINPIPVDYRQTEILAERLFDAQSHAGGFDCVITWVHSTAPEANHAIRRVVANSVERPVPYFRILGSNHASELEHCESMEKIMDRTIRLGYAVNDAGPRWLRWGEISSGVIRAVESDSPETVIGTWPIGEAARHVLESDV